MQVYHLNLSTEKIKAAKFVLLPGDPKRVEVIAKTSPLEVGKSCELAYKREFCTFLSYIENTPVLITSTGIGGPSAAIAIDELAQLGVKTFLRVGTTGAIQPHINVGDVIITTGAVRLDGASTHYAPIEYPAVAHYEVVLALIEAAQTLNIPYHVGVTCSTDTFYPGQERKDSFSPYILRRFQGITEEWRQLNVLNYEMEAATVLTLTSALGLRGGCVTGVVDSRKKSEHITKEGLEQGQQNAVRVAVKAIEKLVRSVKEA